MLRSKVGRWWLATGAVVIVLFVLGPGPTWIPAGLLIAAWGTAMTLNWRGAADAMPRRSGFGPFWTETSPAMIRLIFVFFLLWGIGVAVVGVTHTI